MGPCVSIIGVTEGTVGVLVFKGPKDIFPMVAHVLGISKF